MEEGRSWDFEVSLRKEPWRVKVGDKIYEFEAELDSEKYLQAYRKIQKVRSEVIAVKDEEGGYTPDQLSAMAKANREYLAFLMLPDSARDFMVDKFPDRVLVILAQKVMEYYGGEDNSQRPTGPSSGSSTGSSTGGSSSMARSRSKGSTRASGQ